MFVDINLRVMKFTKLLLIATFFVPLVLISSRFIFPFIVPKILLFRSLVLLSAAGYILLLLFVWPKYKPRLTLITGVVAFFLLSFAISTFLGADWYKSLWDNHERMLGLFTILHFVIFYFILTSTFKKWEDWRLFLRIFLFTGAIVMFIGILQKINPELLLNRGAERVSATLGNAIYFSGYGLFLFFIGLLLFLKEKMRFWKCWATIGGVFGFWGVFGGGTRGTLLGLIVGIFALLLGYLFTLRAHKKMKWAIIAFLIFVSTLLGVLFFFRQTKFISDLPAVGRLLNVSASSDTAGTRLRAWKIAIDGWKERPVFGWGPNNYFYAFNKYYQPEFLELGWGETWFDNAHSAVFNTLATQGTVGLVSYLFLFIAPLCTLWRAYRRGFVDKHVACVGTAFLLGHFTHNAFVFENPTSYLYFFFFLAFVNSQTTDYGLQFTDRRPQITNDKIVSKNFSIGLGAVVVVAVLVLIYLTNVNPARANMGALRSIQVVYSNPALGMELYKKTVLIPSPHIDDIRNDFVRAVTQVTGQVLQMKQPNAVAGLRDIAGFAYQELQKNFLLHPLDIRTHLARAQLGVFITQLTGDPSYLFEAEKELINAHELSPKRQQIQYTLASVKMMVGKKQEAIDLLKQSIENDKKIAEGWWRMAWLYYQIGDKEKAHQVILDARENKVEFTGQAVEVAQIIMNDAPKNKEKK